MSVVTNLEQVGQIVDSAVGGEKCRQSRDTTQLRSVAFWGICDIKYDPRLEPTERVKVLELGDGKSSRFSHHGRPIKEKFDREYCMDKSPPPIKRAVLVENKKFTHDMFVKEGFEHLRPNTASFPRTYHPELATQILLKIGASKDDGVVLKLCNRSRGAGVVVVPGKQDELDTTLKRLLSPPSQDDLFRIMPVLQAKATGMEEQDLHLEQQLHWWSNECPVFIVEKLCHSIPVAKQAGLEEKFDGTMRVAFALHRKQAVNKLSHMSTAPELVKPFEIDWLGGYWKLPKNSTVEGGEPASLHDQIVSSFNSVDKRTAEVPKEHLDEVYEALTPALPVIFHTGALGFQQIQCLYKHDPLFCSFALARIAATMRINEMAKAKQVYDLAKTKVKMVIDPIDPDEAEVLAKNLAKRSALSYISRNEGVCNAMVGEWDEAERKFEASRETLYTNATSYYLLGMCRQEKQTLSTALGYHLISAALDPDFKAPYLALGNTYLQMRKFEDAINMGAACLRRNPDAPQAQFIIGQAIYHICCRKGRSGPQEAAEEMQRKAVAALSIAKERMPGSWTDTDQAMLDYLVGSVADRVGHKEAPVHTWKIPGWRP